MKRLLVIAAIAFEMLVGVLVLDYRRSADAPLNNRETVTFEISKGQNLHAIAEGLQAQGLIDKPHWLRLLGWAENTATRLKYGEYDIPPQTTPRQLLALFASGQVRRYSLTVVEGWTFKQMAELMDRQPGLVHLTTGKPPTEIMAMLDAPGEAMEGRFFPDTYFYIKGMSDLDLLKRAYHKMQTVLAAEWQTKADELPLRSPAEALVLASIIEKESAVADERPRIAGVFTRRLVKGMLLQTDPTVIYGMGVAGDANVNIRKEDLRRDTPYNTYVHSGLPPNPICLPGSGAIHAALHPEPGTSLYFVATGDGRHVFSTTLAEHNQAVNQFQKNHHD